MAVTVMAASIVALINRNNTSGKAFAQDGPTVESPAAVFPGSGFGEIPDGAPGGTACGDFGPPLDISFNVTGMAAPLTDVQLTLTGTHTWVGDVDVTLRAPGGSPEFIIFRNKGAATATACGSNSDLGGPYVFFDAAPASPTFFSVAGVPVPAGNYRSNAPLTGSVTTITPAFAGLTTGQINGTWVMRVRDGGEDDFGTISAASLNLTGSIGGPTPTPTPTPKDVVADFDADGKTDPAVLRAAAAPNSPATWWVLQSQSNSTLVRDWGTTSDTIVPADFDGDLKDDIAIWRPGSQAAFWIIRSTNSTVSVVPFGTNGDDATVVGDYNADNIDDVAVYRPSATPGGQSTWWWMSNNVLTVFAWGTDIDFPAPGDYDGDNRSDYAVQRPTGGDGNFWIWNSNTSTYTITQFGTASDSVVPGDYDGDLRTDLAVIRVVSGTYQWTYRPSGGGADVVAVWGDLATDLPAPGDYNGDGRWDFAIWRPGAQSAFWAQRTDNGASIVTQWGAATDVPVTLSYVH